MLTCFLLMTSPTELRKRIWYELNASSMENTGETYLETVNWCRGCNRWEMGIIITENHLNLWRH